jgi:hypothetical protein
VAGVLSSFGAGVGSGFGAFGILIFGIVIVNCPAAGRVKDIATAKAAISINDDLDIRISFWEARFRGKFSDGVWFYNYSIDTDFCQRILLSVYLGPAETSGWRF